MKKVAHKVAYIAGGIIIGVVFSTSGGAFADTLKSMVGKKVTGEYSVIVDGKELSDKGAIIDGKANVPVRGISEALGADIKVEGRTINITSDIESAAVGNETSSNENNQYIGQSKTELEQTKQIIAGKVLTSTKAGREEVVKGLEEVRKSGNVEAISKWEKSLSEYDAEIAKYEAELKLIDDALELVDK